MSDTSRPPSPRIEPEDFPSGAFVPQPRIETDGEEPIRSFRSAAGRAVRDEAEAQRPHAEFAEPVRPTPRIEQETALSARLALATPDVPDEITGAPDPGWGMPTLVLGGFSVLALGLAGLQTGNFVAEQFHRSDVLGGTTLLVAVVGFGLVLAGIWRELRAVMRLRSVDRLRAALAGADAVARVAAARHWLGMVENGAALRPALDALNDPDAVLPLLRAGVETRLRREADALSRRAAMGVVAGMAATPAPSLVVVLVSWRGLRLIRQVATLYGIRPGLLGMLGLLRRTAGAATATAVTEVAINSAAHAILSTPLLSHLAGEMAGGAVAARRMVLLGRAAAVACTPLPPE